VNSIYLKTDQNPTNQSAIISYDTDRTIFSYHHERQYSIKNFDLFQDYIFIGSIGREVKVLYGEVAELNLRKLGKKVFYNPGGRELKFARDEVLKLLPHIDYYIANVEEACLTINPGLKRDQIEINDLVKMVSDLGPENILITDGDRGVYAYDGYKLHYHPAQKVNLVEKTGAGDAFTSGLIGGISTGLDISKAAQWGNLNSSSAIQSFGAQTGLLTIDQLIELSGFKK
jgi:ribokinase